MEKHNADGSVARTTEERLALKSARAAEGVVAAADYKRDARAAIDRIATLRAVAWLLNSLRSLPRRS